MPTPFFARGASYYPPHHEPSDWPRDVALMAAAGMNCIRSAELIASWDYIEKVRGAPDWGWLDTLFDDAQQHGIKILLGTGSCAPPIWLLDHYPDVQIIDRDGLPYPTGTTWRWACRNHPGYRAELERYLGLLVERYRRHPALWAWQLDNEPGFPCRIRRGETKARLYDYNPHTAAAFRAWLQQKYRDEHGYPALEALNRTWRWTPTHHQYADWNQVQPPRSTPEEWGVLSAWLDWRAFLYENLSAFIAWQHEFIRSLDTQTPTMTNIYCFSGREVDMAFDPWQLARQVDAIGYDLYPGIRRRLQREPEYISLFLDYGRSTALHAGAGFWLPELESGPISGWAKGPDYTTSGDDLIRYNLEALGHGAKAILYQGYREWPALPLHWGALADLAGQPTARYTAAQQVNQMLARHEALFYTAQPARAEVAIYYDTANATVLHSMGADDLLQRCVRGAYQTLWKAGLPVEFINATALARGAEKDQPQSTQSSQSSAAVAHPLTPSVASVPSVANSSPPYRVIVLPCAMQIDEATAQALQHYVAAGGTLVAFAKFGWVDARGWSWPEQPGAGLAELFGVAAGECEQADAITLQFSSEKPQRAQSAPRMDTGAFVSSMPSVAYKAEIAAGHWHIQPLVARAGAQVIGQFGDGRGAVVHQRTGAGQTFYIGTHLDAAALDDLAAAAALLALVQAAGVGAPLRLSGNTDTIDAHLLHAGTQQLVILTNNGPHEAQLTIELPASPAQQASELLHGTPLRFTAAGGTARAEVVVGGWNGVVLLFE